MRLRRHDVLIARAQGMSLTQIASVMETAVAKVTSLYTGKTEFAGYHISIPELQYLEESPKLGTIERLFLDRIANESSEWYDPSLVESLKLRGFYNTDEDSIIKYINMRNGGQLDDV